ncbi:MAG TPA: hypothetical protein VMH61_01040 [Candidatus Acidoferrales bacterium]|nr:hypothetical protein [Candidatus Acidoferrales bacterium]
MERAASIGPRDLLVAALVIGASLGCSGCGSHSSPSHDSITLERLPDTTGLAQGAPIVQGFEAYRMPNGAMRLKGHLNFPDGTRVQVAIRRAAGAPSVAMCQVTVEDHAFDSPPLIGATGPLPVSDYRFELSAPFTSAWQPPEVLDLTDQGRLLRGPGMTRDHAGTPTFWLVEEMKR